MITRYNIFFSWALLGQTRYADCMHNIIEYLCMHGQTRYADCMHNILEYLCDTCKCAINSFSKIGDV